MNALRVEKHVLGSAQADTLGPEFAGDAGIGRRISIGTNFQRSIFVGPFHEDAEGTGKRRLDGGN